MDIRTEKFLTKVIPDNLYIRLLFFKHFKRFPNLKNPQTFAEKLQWLKLYDRRPEYTMLVDKILVKEYIKEKLGEQYVIPTLGAWKHPRDIDFDSLPNRFVLKWNHDSGSVIIVKDKKSLDIEATISRLEKYQEHNSYNYGREWPYKNIVPMVFAEQFMEENTDSTHQGDDGLVDHKFYCFGGKPEFLYISQGLTNHDIAKISFLTMDWEFAPYERCDYAPFDVLPEKPEKLDEMIEICKILSEHIPFVRVDLYQINGQVYFSELTLYPTSGLMKFKNPQHDYEIGKLLQLPEKSCSGD